MKQDILFLHKGFPGQFYHWAAALAARGHRVVFLSAKRGGAIPGVQCFSYEENAIPAGGHMLLEAQQAQVEAGCAVWRSLLQLKEQGFLPQTVVAHVDFGVGLFVKHVFPVCRLIAYCEWYFHYQGNEWDFEPKEHERLRPGHRMQMQLSNNSILQVLQQADVLISPTAWQKSRFPKEYQQRIEVVPDGIDTDFYRPPQQRQQEIPLVTYVSRTMEPFRGFDKVMEAFSLLQRKHKTCRMVLVGQTDRYEYSCTPPHGKTYKEIYETQFPLDLRRTQFTGWVGEKQLLQILQASTVHIYLTRPFVLSWSFLQALATGCAVVASGTAPVLEIAAEMKKENSALELVDYFSPAELAERIYFLLNQAQRRSSLGAAARELVLKRNALQEAVSKQCELATGN